MNRKAEPECKGEANGELVDGLGQNHVKEGRRFIPSTVDKKPLATPHFDHEKSIDFSAFGAGEKTSGEEERRMTVKDLDPRQWRPHAILDQEGQARLGATKSGDGEMGDPYGDFDRRSR